MPDINPAALLQTSASTPQLSSRTLPSLSTQQKKPAQTAPRVDVEQLYTTLKNTIPEHWTAYKDAISNFVLGFLTLDELSRSIDHFICTDPARIHLHNQLLCGIYTNIQREAPEQTVASWVSANDKPTSLAKPLSGDAAEQRLKYEVMQLPPRTRHRLKSIQDEPYAPITHSLLLTREAKWIHNPAAPASHLSAGVGAASSASGGGGGSGGSSGSGGNNASTSASGNAASSSSSNSAGASAGASGLNKELEIRKKYHLSLSTETRDIPGLSSLTERLVPTCYEVGLSSGPEAPEVVAELLSTALDAFVKEMITRIVGRSRVNGPLSGPESESSSMFVPPATSATAAATTSSATSSTPAAIINGAAPTTTITTTANITTSATAAATTPTITTTTITSTVHGEANGAPSIDPSQQASIQPPPPPSRAAAVAAAAAAGLGASTIANIGITTRAYKKKIEREEAAAAKGDLKRSDMGLLPVEVAALREPRTGRNMRGDIGLAWELGDSWLGGMMPWLGEKVVLNEFAEFEAARAHYGVANNDGDGTDGRSHRLDDMNAAAAGGGSTSAIAGKVVNGASGSTTGEALSGANDVTMIEIDDDAMLLDDTDNTWGWAGAQRDDRRTLGTLLDDCLSIGL